MKIKAKYFFDYIFAIVLIVLLAPVLIIISILIKLEDGNDIFFIQQRNGLYGKKINVIKFRTMIINADIFLDKNGLPTKDRITFIGSFLRRNSIDELPQIFNILKGEMSFIGPRPTLTSHLNRYTDFQKRRFLMKPGITGLAQVSGRNEIPWSERIKLDIKYIENYSFWLDIVVAYKTIKVLFNRSGNLLDRNSSFADDLNENK